MKIFYILFFSILVAGTLPIPAYASATHKHRTSNNGSVPGYGFLPGVRTPQQIERP